MADRPKPIYVLRRSVAQVEGGQAVKNGRLWRLSRCCRQRCHRPNLPSASANEKRRHLTTRDEDTDGEGKSSTQRPTLSVVTVRRPRADFHRHEWRLHRSTKRRNAEMSTAGRSGERTGLRLRSSGCRSVQQGGACDSGGYQCDEATRRLLQQFFDRLFKLVMIGNSGVGKTSFLSRYTGCDYSPAYRSTVGIDFKMKTVERASQRLKLQIWDTSGQERFQSVTTAYYRGAMGFVVMYDVTNEQSFGAVETWLSHVHEKCDRDVPIVLVANKTDADDCRSVSTEAGKKMAERLGFPLFEASAKDDINVDAVFDCIIDMIYHRMTQEMNSRRACTCHQRQQDEDNEEDGCCLVG